MAAAEQPPQQNRPESASSSGGLNPSAQRYLEQITGALPSQPRLAETKSSALPASGLIPSAQQAVDEILGRATTQQGPKEQQSVLPTTQSPGEPLSQYAIAMLSRMGKISDIVPRPVKSVAFVEPGQTLRETATQAPEPRPMPPEHMLRAWARANAKKKGVPVEQEFEELRRRYSGAQETPQATPIISITPEEVDTQEVSEEKLRITEEWAKEWTHGFISLQSAHTPEERKRYLVMIAQKVRQQRKLLDETYPRSLMYVPGFYGGVEGMDWEKQRTDLGMNTCQFAAVGNALRSLGVYDEERHSEEAFIRHLGGDTYVKSVKGAGLIGASTRDVVRALRELCPEVQVERTDSVHAILQAVKEGAATVVPLLSTPSHVGSIPPKDRVSRDTDGQLYVPVVDPLSGVNDNFPIERLIKSDITLAPFPDASAGFIIRKVSPPAAADVEDKSEFVELRRDAVPRTAVLRAREATVAPPRPERTPQAPAFDEVMVAEPPPRFNTPPEVPTVDEAVREQLQALYNNHEFHYRHRRDLHGKAYPLEAQLSKTFGLTPEENTEAVVSLNERNRKLRRTDFSNFSTISHIINDSVRNRSDDLLQETLNQIPNDSPDAPIRDAYNRWKASLIAKRDSTPGEYSEERRQINQALAAASEEFQNLFEARIGLDKAAEEEAASAVSMWRCALRDELQEHTYAWIRERLPEVLRAKNRAEIALLQMENARLEKAAAFFNPLFQQTGITIIPSNGLPGQDPMLTKLETPPSINESAQPPLPSTKKHYNTMLQERMDKGIDIKEAHAETLRILAEEVRRDHPDWDNKRIINQVFGEIA